MSNDNFTSIKLLDFCTLKKVGDILMRLNNETFTITKIEGKEILSSYFISQRKTGLLAGIIGLITLITSIFLLSISLDYIYISFVLFAIGMVKSIVYFSNFFVMKTKISINLEMYEIDPNSFLLEQKYQMRKTQVNMRKMILLSIILIFIIIYFLVAWTMSIALYGILLALIVQATITSFIFRFAYKTAKEYGKKLGN